MLSLTLVGGFLVALWPAPRSAAASFLTDAASHPPPATGGFAYNTFVPTQPGFPAKGQSFVDPVFGNTITRLTSEVGTHSWSDIYSKNGNFNADNTLMAHNTPGGRQFINPATGAVVRPSVPGNDNSSFDPVDPDVWWWYAIGGATLNKYSVSSGSSTVVKTFSEPIRNNGGSIDWIDRTGRYMVLHLGNTWRMYDVKADVLYATTGFGRYPDDPQPAAERIAGLFGSRDGGRTWRYLWEDLQPRYTRPMCIDPRAPHALTVGCAPSAFSSYRDEGGAKSMLYQTLDGGDTWRSLGDADHSPSAANILAVEPALEGAGSVLVGTDTGEVWRVSPAAEWTLLASGLPLVQAVLPVE